MNKAFSSNPSRAGNTRISAPMIDTLNNQLSQVQTTVNQLSTQITSLNIINDELRQRIAYLENVILTLTGIQ